MPCKNEGEYYGKREYEPESIFSVSDLHHVPAVKCRNCVWRVRGDHALSDVKVGMDGVDGQW